MDLRQLNLILIDQCSKLKADSKVHIAYQCTFTVSPLARFNDEGRVGKLLADVQPMQLLL